ncbi:MAG: histidine phosphatase family protein [Micromonosporaceae bacterium]
MRLIFVRHAESEANVSGSLDCSVPGPGLSPFGFQQAAALPSLLAEDLDGMPLRAIWASTMLRAQQTAEPVSDRYGVPLQVHPLLHEGHVGDLNGRVDDEAYQALYELFACWHVEGDMERCRPGGETGTQLVDRLRAAVNDVIAAGDPTGDDLAAGGDEAGAAVVVSHGAILRVGLPWLCENVTKPYTMTHHLPNTARVVVDVLDRDQPKLVCRTWDGTPPD